MSLAVAIQAAYPEAFGRRRAILLLQEMAAEWGYSSHEITGPARHSGLVKCRRAIVIELRSLGMSWQEVGAVMNRHHTTCMSLAGAL